MKRFLFIILILATGNITFAQILKTWLSNDTVNFAKPVVLNVEFELNKGQSIKLPDFHNAQLSPNLKIIASQLDTVEKNGKFILTHHITLLPIDDTVLKIPSLVYNIGNQLMQSDSLILFVLPIEIDSAQIAQIDTSQIIDIFDVTKPLDVPLTLRELWLRFRFWILGFVLTLIALAIIFWLYKRYKARKSQKQLTEEQKLEPHELALMRLEKLKDRQLYQAGRYKEFYSQLSEIMRQYIELRYQIQALELTTSELELLLSQAKLFDTKLFSGLMTLLKNADLVKFAKYQPPTNICQNDLQFAFEFVEHTKPIIIEENSDNQSNQSEKQENQQ